jgi:DNA-directed RNA polymerase subunit M/transcription elongation factor TFIIS
MKAVILLVDGNINQISLKIKSNMLLKTSSQLINNKLMKLYLNKLGDGKCLKLGEWNIGDDNYLEAYGHIKGIKDLENNHELPPQKTYQSNIFGDILVVKVNEKKNLLDLECSQYEEHYGELFGYNSDSEGINISDQETESEESDIEIEEYDSESEDDKEIEENDFEDDLNNLEDINEDNTDDEDKFISNKIKKPKIIGKTKKNNNDSWSDWDSNKLTLDDETENTYIIESMDSDEDNLYIINDLRVSMRELFKKFNKKDEIVNKLETGILDNVCEICDKRKIVKKWENINFKKIYMNKCRSIYTNLDTDSYIKNDYLINQILVNPGYIGKMSYQEIFPKHWKKLLDNKFKREEAMYKNQQHAMTDEFKCRRCKSRKTSYYELQTRSADEAMTIFITCLNCGNRWKQ